MSSYSSMNTTRRPAHHVFGGSTSATRLEDHLAATAEQSVNLAARILRGVGACVAAVAFFVGSIITMILGVVVAILLLPVVIFGPLFFAAVVLTGAGLVLRLLGLGV